MMRMLHYAPHTDEIDQETRLTRRSSQPTDPFSWPPFAALRTVYDALCEGLAAYRQYERLMSRGIPHDTAISAALGVGHRHSWGHGKWLCHCALPGKHEAPIVIAYLT